MIIITQAIVLTIILGFCMFVIQATLSSDSFDYLDIYISEYIPDFKWFGRHAWTNKYTWFIKLFGKEYHIFKYYPFIMFTDFMHLCHSIFGLSLGYLGAVLSYEESTIHKLLIFAGISLIYSTTFEIFYSNKHK